MDSSHPSLLYLQEVVAKRPNKPEVLIICGSGLSGLAGSVSLSTKQVVYYKDIPGFPQVSVEGHAAELVFGQISNVECLVMRGRFHFYECHDMNSCVLPVRIARVLGCSTTIVTNASGGMREDFQVGDIAILHDHIGLCTLTGSGPLMGKNHSNLGPRFPPMSNAYDVQLQKLAYRLANNTLHLAECIKRNATYCYVSGPQYETPSECAMLRTLGAHCVGMSTVPEVIAARHCGMRVLALSLITNKVVLPGELAPKHASHEEVLETTAMRSHDVQRLVESVLAHLHHDVEVEVGEDHEMKRPRLESGMDVVKRRLQTLDLSRMTPIEAMCVLDELKKTLEKE